MTVLRIRSHPLSLVQYTFTQFSELTLWLRQRTWTHHWLATRVRLAERLRIFPAQKVEADQTNDACCRPKQLATPSRTSLLERTRLRHLPFGTDMSHVEDTCVLNVFSGSIVNSPGGWLALHPQRWIEPRMSGERQGLGEKLS